MGRSRGRRWRGQSHLISLCTKSLGRWTEKAAGLQASSVERHVDACDAPGHVTERASRPTSRGAATRESSPPSQALGTFCRLGRLRHGQGSGRGHVRLR